MTRVTVSKHFKLITLLRYLGHAGAGVKRIWKKRPITSYGGADAVRIGFATAASLDGVMVPGGVRANRPHGPISAIGLYFFPPGKFGRALGF